MNQRAATPLLRLDEVSAGYGRHAVLRGLNLEIAQGSFTCLLGANGSGKSTLLRTILGILPPLAGQVEWVGRSVGPPVVGYVPQREALDSVFPVSCFEMVLMGACGRVRPGRFLGAAEKSWAQQCLRETGTEGLARRRFSETSGGQKQRVLIARALMTRPEFLVLDEPTAGIDAGATQDVLDLLKRLHAQQTLTVLMVNHDLAAVRQCAEQIIWLREGQLTQGAAQELLRREHVEAWLGIGETRAGSSGE